VDIDIEQELQEVEESHLRQEEVRQDHGNWYSIII